MHLARHEGKGGKTNVLSRTGCVNEIIRGHFFSHCFSFSWPPSSVRREQLRLLKYLEPNRYTDGLKEQLTDEQVAQSFWLLTGLPPFLKLRELRAGKMASLIFACI